MISDLSSNVVFQNVIAEMRNSLAQARGAGEVSQTSEVAKRMSVASEQGTGHTFIMIDRAEIIAPDNNINIHIRLN